MRFYFHHVASGFLLTRIEQGTSEALDLEEVLYMYSPDHRPAEGQIWSIHTAMFLFAAQSAYQKGASVFTVDIHDVWA